MKPLYSQTPNPSYYHLNNDILLINNSRSIEFILPDGETIHYPVPNIKGKITAITTSANKIILAESAYSVNIHIFTVVKISKGNVQIKHDKPIELNSFPIYSQEESTKTFFNTMPNDIYYEVKDLSLSDHSMLAILLPNKCLVLHLQTMALTVSKENENLHVSEDQLVEVNNYNTDFKSFNKIKWSLDPTKFFIYSDYKFRVFKLDLISGFWSILNEYQNFIIDNLSDFGTGSSSGELVETSAISYQNKDLALEQDLLESRNSTQMIDDAITRMKYKTKLDEIIAKNMDTKIVKVLPILVDTVAILTNRNKLFIVSFSSTKPNQPAKISNFFKDSGFKSKSKTFVPWNEYINNRNNRQDIIDVLEDADCKLIDVKIGSDNQNSALKLNFSKFNFEISAHLVNDGGQQNQTQNFRFDQISINFDENALKQEQEQNQDCMEMEEDEETQQVFHSSKMVSTITISKIIGNFQIHSDNSISYKNNQILGPKPSFKNLSSTFISLNEMTTWLAVLDKNTSHEKQISFYNAQNNKFIFRKNFQEICKELKDNVIDGGLKSFGTLLYFATKNGSFFLYKIEPNQEIILLAGYKIFEDSVVANLSAISSERLAVSNSNSSKVFIFNLTLNCKLEKIIKSKNIKDRAVVFRHLAFDDKCNLIYSAAPVLYKCAKSCVLGKITFGAEGVITHAQAVSKKSFLSDFALTPSNNRIRAKSGGKYLYEFNPNNLSEDADEISPLITNQNGPEVLSNSKLCAASGELLMPDNEHYWVSPIDAKGMSIHSCWSHLLVKTGNRNNTQDFMIFRLSGLAPEPNFRHITPLDQDEIDTKNLLEDKILKNKTKELQRNYKSEREVIQSKLDVLINEIKKAKTENSKLPDIEKLNPAEIVLDKNTIQKRETEKRLAAERLEHELKNRIAIAMAREELLDIHCEEDFVQRDGRIKYLKKSMTNYCNFYEKKMDKKLNFTLDLSDSIAKEWQDILVEEYRIQASAMTEQQQKELDDAEAKGGDSVDDVMQKMASRGMGFGWWSKFLTRKIFTCSDKFYFFQQFQPGNRTQLKYFSQKVSFVANELSMYCKEIEFTLLSSIVEVEDSESE